MWTRLRSGDPAMLLLWAAVILSFAFWLLVLWLGFEEPLAGAGDRYKTYFQMPQWWVYPFFFLGLAPGLWLSWRPMLDVWARLAETEVLQGAKGPPDAAALAQVRNAVERPRRIAVLAALAVALFVNFSDRATLFHLYGDEASLAEQQAYACAEPTAFMKWILTAHDGSGFLCDALREDETERKAASAKPGIAPPAGQILFAGFTALQQGLIVFLAALAVLQMLLQTAIFGLFERLAVARTHGLRLLLNCRSPFNEFGLEHWNHALNNFYWAVSPALLGVFISRTATPPEDYLPGQVMLGIAVPSCLVAPMIATILVRQARLFEAWKTVQPQGPVDPEDYRRQQLWPLDRNWSSKLGIVLAFALAALSIGFEVNQLVLL